MKTLKLLFIAIVTISFCSFIAKNRDQKEEKIQLLSELKSKFEKINFSTKISFDKLSDPVISINSKINNRIKFNNNILESKFDRILPFLKDREFSRMGPRVYFAHFLLESGKHNILVYSSKYPHGDDYQTLYAIVVNEEGNIVGNEIYLDYAMEEFTKGTIEFSKGYIEVNSTEKYNENTKHYNSKFGFDKSGIYKIEKTTKKA